MPVIIALGYATITWGYAPIGLATNTARDVGGPMMAVAIWETKANGGAYAAIAALTNILTSSLSLVVYDSIFADSSRSTEPFKLLLRTLKLRSTFLPTVVSPDHLEHLRAQEAQLEYRTGKSFTKTVPARPDGSSDNITV
jgi:hypothetical protein